MTFLGDSFGKISKDTNSDNNMIMNCGTEDMLTCHAVVMHHTFTQVTALAHFDEFVQKEDLDKFVRSVP